MTRTTATIPPVINQEYEYVSVDLLKFHPRNVRQADLGAIYESIKDNGFFGACVVQRSTNDVLIGNHRLAAAREHGLPAVPVIWVDCDDDRALRIMLADNQTGDLATNNEPKLAELLAELANTPLGLSGTSFSGDDLDQLISDLAYGDKRGGLLDGADPDAIPEDAPTRCRAGDLWRLGEHRLLCGDSTDTDNIACLFGDEKCDIILTDPPYYSGGFQEAGRTVGSTSAVKQKATISRDNLTTEGLESLIEKVIGRIPSQGCCYVFCDWRQIFAIRRAVEPSGYQYRSLIVWDKGTPGMGGPWRHQYELAFFGTRRKEPPVGKSGDVLHFPRTGNVNHTTEKPVALLVAMLENTEGELVADPFLGSGTTLIAAEETGRRCYGLELEPRYCDVVLSRFEQCTGKQAELIEHGRTQE